jgi:AcrR family transcriptional regulator
MPKLSPAQIVENKTLIEKAALKCFLQFGYHGVTIRQIAQAAQTSVGNLYNYYPDKVSLFRSVFDNLTEEFRSASNPVWDYLKTSQFPDDIEVLAKAIEASVKKYAPYFKMTYIDVVEFNGNHVADVFSNVYGQFAPLLKGKTKDTSGDPTFAFVAVYLQIYYFFALKQLFKAKNIFGEKTDEEVIENLIALYKRGLK